MLVQGGSGERAGTQDPGDQEAGMDTVASSTGPAIAGDRSGEGALVIVVGGFQGRASGAARAQLAGPVLVVVLGGWPPRVLPGELAVRPDLGDAGALLDATAKAAYQARLAELGAEPEEAEAGNDPARASRARAEREFLVAELARAVGLGGRDRRAASHAERARLNVTRAIRAAVANLARDHPSLGRHLAATVRTGRYCSYIPDPRAPITWER